MQNTKLRVAIYIRVSDKEQGDKFWPIMQENACRSYINIREDKLELAEWHIYKDIDVSWTLPRHERPQMTLLMNEIINNRPEDRPFDLVIVYKIDRFARNLKYLLDIVTELDNNKAGFISANESIDTSTPFGKAMLAMLGVFAELERSTIQSRMDDWYDTAVKQGSWMQDKYWYKRIPQWNLYRPVVNPKEAKVVCDIFDWYVYGGLNISQIAKRLQEERVPIPSASNPQKLSKKPITNPYFWRIKTVNDILENEIYIGKYYHTKSKIVKIDKYKTKQVALPKEEWILSEHSHEPIIAEVLFNMAQERLNSKKWTFRTAKEPYLLSWLIRCNACKEYHARGMITWVGTQTAGKKVYQCQGKHMHKGETKCTATPLNKDELEFLVLSQIKRIFNKPEVLAEYVEKNNKATGVLRNYQRQLHNLEVQKKKKEQWLENLKDLYTWWEIEKQEYVDRTKILQRDIQGIEEKKAEIMTITEKTAQTEQYIEWIKWLKQILAEEIDIIMKDPEKCRILLNLIISHIIIYSKPLDKWIKLAGRKKEWQNVPYLIRIFFKLPWSFLDAFYNSPDNLDNGPQSWEDKWKKVKAKTNISAWKSGNKGKLTDRVSLLSKRDSFTGIFFVFRRRVLK